jgi:hypothetical protein
VRIVALSLALTACIPAPPPGEGVPAPGDGAPAEDACGASRVAGFAGRTRSESLAEEIARISGARRVRWIRPGDAVTMDYLPERLNVHLDARDRIERFACS